MPTPAQTDPAEGPRDDGAAAKVDNHGVAAETPAEGADDAPAEQPGSPAG